MNEKLNKFYLELDSLVLSSKNEKKEYKGKIKETYLKEDKALKEEIKSNILSLKENYKKEVENIENHKVTSLKNENIAFDLVDKSNKKEISNHKDVIKGIEIQAKRAKVKAYNDLNEAIKNEKLRRYDLHEEYLLLIKKVGLKPTILENYQSKLLENKANFNFVAILKNKKTYINLVPLMMLVVIIILYYVGKAITGYNGDLGDVINQGIFVAVVATGAVYIYSQGGFDMSLGSSSLTCAIIAAVIYNATNNIVLALLIAVVCGALLGIINAVLATMLNLPVMVMTLTMMNILSAINEEVLNQNGGLIYPKDGLPKNAWTYAVILLTFFIICWALFNYTKLGRRNKFIGSNKKAAKFNGISLMKAGMVSFGISGIGLGICGFLFASSTSGGGSFGATTVLSQVGLNVVIAIVFGGMTTSGGPKSKISCAVIGAFFSVFLDEFFAAISTPSFSVGNYCYMVKGIIFIVVSLANMWDTRSKMLASGGSIQ